MKNTYPIRHCKTRKHAALFLTNRDRWASLWRAVLRELWRGRAVTCNLPLTLVKVGRIFSICFDKVSCPNMFTSGLWVHIIGSIVIQSRHKAANSASIASWNNLVDTQFPPKYNINNSASLSLIILCDINRMFISPKYLCHSQTK